MRPSARSSGERPSQGCGISEVGWDVIHPGASSFRLPGRPGVTEGGNSDDAHSQDVRGDRIMSVAPRCLPQTTNAGWSARTSASRYRRGSVSTGSRQPRECGGTRLYSAIVNVAPRPPDGWHPPGRQGLSLIQSSGVPAHRPPGAGGGQARLEVAQGAKLRSDDGGAGIGRF